MRLEDSDTTLESSAAIFLESYVSLHTIYLDPRSGVVVQFSL